MERAAGPLPDSLPAPSEASRCSPLYRQALADFEKKFGPEDWELALVLNNLALLCAKTGRHAEAISHFQRALVIWERAFSPNHPNVARALTNLAGF